MKKTIFLIALITGVACGNDNAQPEKTETVTQEKTADVSYVKGDLQKIKWIEGEWMGLYNGKPFYEMYRMANDSTLEIRSYEWNGTDSSHTEVSYVYFKDGSYYLGDKQNWKVTSITDKEIKMAPNREANNDITWKHRDSTGWDAILVHKNGTNIYNMKHFNPFKK
jgi:hypothetical protein